MSVTDLEVQYFGLKCVKKSKHPLWVVLKRLLNLLFICVIVLFILLQSIKRTSSLTRTYPCDMRQKDESGMIIFVFCTAS